MADQTALDSSAPSNVLSARSSADQQVRLWGITQHRIRNGHLREEWMVFNEFDLLQTNLKNRASG